MHIQSVPLETEIKKNNKIVSKIEQKYENPAHLFPTSVLTNDIQNNAAITELTFNKYDSKGKLQQYTTKNGVPISIVWGYNNTEPIAKVEGIAYDQLVSFGLVSSIVSASDSDYSNPANETALITALENFRKNSNLAGTQITTYTYDPLIGVTSITPPTGIREIYIYDTANRLKEVKQQEKDVNGNLIYKTIKEYKYNYKP